MHQRQRLQRFPHELLVIRRDQHVLEPVAESVAIPDLSAKRDSFLGVREDEFHPDDIADVQLRRDVRRHAAFAYVTALAKGKVPARGRSRILRQRDFQSQIDLVARPATLDGPVFSRSR